MSLLFDSGGGGIMFADGGGALFDDGNGNACCCILPCGCCKEAIKGAYMSVDGVGSDICVCEGVNGNIFIPADPFNPCAGTVLVDDSFYCECNNEIVGCKVQYEWFLTCSQDGPDNMLVVMYVSIRGGVCCDGVFGINSGLGFNAFRAVSVRKEDAPIDCIQLMSGAYPVDEEHSSDPQWDAGCDRPDSVTLTLVGYD